MRILKKLMCLCLLVAVVCCALPTQKVEALSYSSTKTLATTYTDITSDKPWNDQTVTVTNSVGNPSWIMVQFVNKDGAIITSSTSGIKAGSSDSFKLKSGTSYTIRIKAEVSGNYKISIKD